MRQKANPFFILGLIAILVACAPSIQTPEVSLPTPTSVPAILPTPASIAAFEEHLVAEIHIEREPDELVFAAGSIWTKTANGHVIQVDPATNMAVGDIKVDTTSDPYHYCQGLGTDGEHIWACSASGDADNRTIDVVRIDPASQSILATVKVEKVFDQLDLPFLLDRIWVLSGDGSELIGIDVGNNQPSSAIDLGARCFQLAVDGQSLLATCALEDLVLRIDPEKGEVTQRVPLQKPRNIIANQNSVWVFQDNAVVRLDPESLNPVAAFTDLPGVGSKGDIFLTEEAVWMRHDSGFLYRIDPASNAILEQFKTDRRLSYGSLLVESGSIWTTAIEDNLLFRLSLK